METKSDYRLPAIDLLRGLVMVLMALDHTRDFFSNQLQFDPSDPQKASPELYFTRWISHFCAPVFIFLAGVGASLAGDRITKPELALFLFVRGLWLVLLELTLVRWGWWFAFDYHAIILMVIWAIGMSMMILAGLSFFPRWIALAFALMLIVGHNALPKRPIDLATNPIDAAASILYYNGYFHLGEEVVVFAAYKIVPWCGVMALGYAIGPLFRLPSNQRRPALLAVGLLLSAAFVALRWSNAYGDPRPWSQQESTIQTAMSFLRCEKYPPSLCYLLMTLGPALILLGIFDRPPNCLSRRLIVIGRVPLFFYLLHLPLIHALAIATNYYMKGAVDPWLLAPAQNAQAPKGYGYDLPWVYAAWIVIVLFLYPLCAWFAERKRQARGGWMSYF